MLVVVQLSLGCNAVVAVDAPDCCCCCCCCCGGVWFVRDEGDDVGLDVEQVRVDLEEGGEVLRGLEQGRPQVDVEVVGHQLKQLVHM